MPDPDIVVVIQEPSQVRISEGVVGTTGPPGPQGVPGFDGATGPPGADGAPGAPGAMGAPGADGSSVTIQGGVETEDDLPETGNIGDGYITFDTGHLWVWDDGLGDWRDVGNITGPQGPQGDPGATGATGPRGADGVTAWRHGDGPPTYFGDAHYYFDDLTGNIYKVAPPDISYWVMNFTGPPGADSTIPGPQGEIGPQGDTGPEGPAGADSTVPGPQGDQGPQGDIGPEGPQGAPGDPGEAGIFSAIASQVEAEAGTDNAKGMTPLRVAQAITALGGGGSASAFTDLTDTPAAYTGAGGKVVAVKSDASGLEFVTPSGGGGGGADLREIWLKG